MPILQQIFKRMLCQLLVGQCRICRLSVPGRISQLLGQHLPIVITMGGPMASSMKRNKDIRLRTHASDSQDPRSVWPGNIETLIDGWWRYRFWAGTESNRRASRRQRSQRSE